SNISLELPSLLSLKFSQFSFLVLNCCNKILLLNVSEFFLTFHWN
ncbi:unnamed protein product, partial [Prunus brigantina]